MLARRGSSFLVEYINVSDPRSAALRKRTGHRRGSAFVRRRDHLWLLHDKDLDFLWRHGRRDAFLHLGNAKRVMRRAAAVGGDVASEVSSAQFTVYSLVSDSPLPSELGSSCLRTRGWPFVVIGPVPLPGYLAASMFSFVLPCLFLALRICAVLGGLHCAILMLLLLAYIFFLPSFLSER